jgi:hypothetical protein
MNKIFKPLSFAVFGAIASALTLSNVQAPLSLAASSAASKAQVGVNAVGGGGAPQLEATITTIVNTLLYAVGIVAVIAIIVAGLQYILAAGDQAKITKAKDTILYAVVGIVVAALAFAIVTFVTGRL